MDRKGIGFTGQRIIEIPKDIVKKCRKMPLINNLYITKMGLYPKARHHYFNRPKGILEVILIYCTDGEGWIKLPDLKLNLKAGEVYVIPSGIPHSYGSLNENPWTIFWIHLNGTACNEAVKAVMGNADLPARAINAGVYKERLLIFEGIEQVLLKGYSVNNLMYANLSLQYFLASFILPDNFQPPELINVPLSSSEKAIEFMQNNLSRPAVLLDIANGVNLSVSYFSRIFKKDTGYSPVEYFNYLKIQRACQLLHSGNLRINEVAMAIGVEDAFYFSRLFKKQIGIPPAKYRKANQMLQ